MSWTRALVCLAAGGCVTGVVVGTTFGSKSGGNSAFTQTSTESEGQEKRSQFLERLKASNGCLPSDSAETEKEQFGTIYFCSDSSLYYLEEERAFDWERSLDELMSLFQKVKRFNYKEEGTSQTYLLIELEGGSETKKVLLDSSYDGENWNEYQGFDPLI